MPIKYTETHRLYSDADRASAHVVLHLQGVDLPAAQLFVSRMSDVAGGFVRSYVSALPDGVLLPQTSGPCVHYDPEGVASPNGDGEAGEHQGEAPVCAYPSERGLCPHLDNPEILCPVKDSLYAMHEVARMRSVCEAEQDADMAAVAPSQTYETAAPEWVEPEPEEAPGYAVPAQEKPGRKPHPNAWSDEEEAVIRRAYCAAEAERLYSEAFPDSTRTAAAVTSRWYRLRDAGTLLAPDPLPDFVGDVVPVTQCEEPVFLPGDRVRLVNNPDIVGEVVYVAANGRYVSVQFPRPGPAKVCAIDLIEGVGA